MSDIIFCGEALIDFVPRDVAGEGTAFLPKPGGSPFNATKAAAKAGGHALFCGAVSDEFFGDMLLADLEAAGVDVRLVQKLDHLTTLAFVDFSTGGPRYAFHDEGTASRNFAPGFGDWSPSDGSIVSFGSVSLIGNPAAEAFADFAVAKSADMMVALDPNVRESLIKDADAWHTRLDRMLGVASILKLSVEDLEFMAPDTKPADYAVSMIERGLCLVIVTDGEHGATAYTAAGSAHVPTPHVDVVDTVGAGDTLMGSALVWLTENALNTREALKSADADQLTELLEFATTAAAINCTRAGCNPPTRAEIDAALV